MCRKYLMQSRKPTSLLRAGGKLKIVLAVLIFCIIVISHELGHFLIAKANGIAVTEFCIGFGPTIIGFTRNGTKYSIKPIPLGGACIFDDEDPEKLEESSFLKANVWARIATIAAGPIFNFILAFILALFVIGSTGYPTAKLIAVTPDSPAAQAGIVAGDRIVKMGNEKIHLYQEVQLKTFMGDGETMQVTYEHDGAEHAVNITPEYNEEYGRYLYGFTGGYFEENKTPLKTIQYSGYYVGYQIKATFKSLQMLLTGKVSVKQLSGPVGMTAVVGEQYDAVKKEGVATIILAMLDIAILLSANLGVVNLLPLPALDGGRLVFMFIEAVRGKPISPEKEGMVHFVGMALLMLLMVFVMYNDIARLFTK